jgi:steroid 5-alpha reductase family enzyme
MDLIAEGMSAVILSRDSNPLGWMHYTAIGLFVFGSVLETSFDLELYPKNKDKLLTHGLHGIVQHGNYFGFFCWYTGGTFTTQLVSKCMHTEMLLSGHPLMLLWSVWHLLNFLGAAIPGLQVRYCTSS